ncbi:putative E3 ubiquitin-protein ligase RING1a [Salvia miltiorrhiza]|uniref:putative E3 ubiquitin-protein ligase RING1a n=1 Tax=Salvia miltiorrhiza TaxID=226208 RepID=UPI0025ACDB94|nr:putative E3 ubiquitin-protein ligase RING1a [Salvia miltiorrhiza]
MPAQNRDDSRRGRRRKRPPTRFSGGGAPPPPPHQEHQHAPPQQQIQETPAVMDSDDSGTDPEEFDEVITVSLSELRSNVQCPICLGIVKKTRTVMGCLHRFCRECIDKSMRLGNKECPACRMHCPSRRSLRDDNVFDSFIRSVFPDVEKYEQEELVLYEEEKAVNEQLQASMNECFQRQAEASRARKGKASASRMDQMCRKSGLRLEFGESSNAPAVFKIKDDDDHQPIYAIPTPCIVGDEQDAEAEADTDLPAWGGAGFRSQARRAAAAAKAIQSSRVETLAHHLADVEKNDHQHVVTTHLQNDELIWVKDFNNSVLVDLERFGNKLKPEPKAKAQAQAQAPPHISGSVWNLILKGERLMDAMKN